MLSIISILIAHRNIGSSTAAHSSAGTPDSHGKQDDATFFSNQRGAGTLSTSDGHPPANDTGEILEEIEAELRMQLLHANQRGAGTLSTREGHPTGEMEEATFVEEAEIRMQVQAQPQVLASVQISNVAPVVDRPRRDPPRKTITTLPGTSDASNIARSNQCHNTDLQEEGLQHAADLRKAWLKFKEEDQQTIKTHTYCIARCAGREVSKSNAGKQLVKAQMAWLPVEGLHCCEGATRTAADAIVLSEGKAVEDDGTSDITLVTQGTSNRIDAVTDQLDHWPGPVVAVFSIANYTNDLAEVANSELRDIEVACKKWHRPNLRVLVLTLDFPEGVDYISKMMRQESKLGLYPVNAMRNLALDQAQTNWVFPVDMDFIPCATLYRRMKSFYLERLSQINRPSVVIPHFEVPNCKKEGLPLPKTFDELIVMTVAELAMPFHVKATRLMGGIRDVLGFPSRTLYYQENKEERLHKYRTVDCHRPSSRSWAWGILATNYSRWFYESQLSLGLFRIPVPWNPKDPGNVARLPKSLRGKPCPTERSSGLRLPREPDAPKCGRVGFLSAESWEPFVMFRRVEVDTEPKVPRYSEKYIGRYKNKVEFVTKLRAQRYKFFTMHGEFIVHKPHAVSKATSDDQQIMKSLMIELHEREARQLTEEMLNLPDPNPSRYEGGFTCTFEELGEIRDPSRVAYGYHKGGHSSLLGGPDALAHMRNASNNPFA